MNAKRNIPPAQEDVESGVKSILEHGDVKDLAALLGEPYETTRNKFDPNKPAARSEIFKAVRVICEMRQLDDGDRKAREVLDLITDFIFPTADPLQLVNRIEQDARRLKAKLTEGS